MALNKNPRMFPTKSKPKPTKPTNAQIAKAAIKKAQANKPKPKPSPGPSPRPTTKYVAKKAKPMPKKKIMAPGPKKSTGPRKMPSREQLMKDYLIAANGKRGGNSLGDYILETRRAYGYKNQMDYR
jgi:hypothetical protein